MANPALMPYVDGEGPYKGTPPPPEVLSQASRRGRFNKRRLLGIGAVVVVVAAVGALVGTLSATSAAAGGGGGGGGDGDVRAIELPAPGTSQNFQLEVGAVIGVKPSQEGQVVVISDGVNLAPQARSYNGRDWEVLQGVSVVCDPSMCRISIAKDVFEAAAWSLVISTYEHRGLSQDNRNARFLEQATFGPTKADIAALGGDEGRFRAWIEAQAKLPPTLLREYYRRRANPPTRVQTIPGRPRGACEAGSRWHRHAFTADDVGSLLTVVEHPEYFELQVDGVPRHHWANKATWKLAAGNGPYKICSAGPGVNTKVTVGTACGQSFSNPGIVFRTAPPADRTLNVAAGGLEELTPSVAGHRILAADTTPCNVPATGAVFAKAAGGNVFLHNPRLALLENSLESPSRGGAGGTNCPNVPMTFLNAQAGCKVVKGACSPTQYSNASFELNYGNLRKFFTAGGKYVYRAMGLKNDAVASPCNAASRWSVETGACATPSTGINAATLATLRGLLVASFANDGNPVVRDVPPPAAGDVCTAAQAVRAVVSVEHQGQTYCFSQVHRDLFNVYDMSQWALPHAHPGNKVALNGGRANPITKHAEQGNAVGLPYPGSHPTERWETGKRFFRLVGRFRDSVRFNQLPSSLQTPELGQAFGAVQQTPSDPSRAFGLICGSPGEVAQEPKLGARFGFSMVSVDDAVPGQGRMDERVGREEVQTAVWTAAALFAPDQLRQRVAWALSQILVASATDTVNRNPSEMFLTYYDIFVRNGLGLYRDALREVSYSPIMGRMLSFVNSRSLQSSGSFPDENFAREIMQLFTMGLVELEQDGTAVLDAETGVPVPTYSNEDILEYSRLWTGFTWQRQRSNYETVFGPNSVNDIDPMQLRGEWRDPFPKLGLRERYVGDGLPVCEDLPERAFLRKGAVYRFLGNRWSPELQQDPTRLPGEQSLRVELDTANSPLAAKLCGGDASDLSTCKWQPQVELDANLECQGVECEIQVPRIVMLPTRKSRCPDDTVLERRTSNAARGDVCRDAHGGDAFVCPVGCSAVDAAPFCVVAGGDATEPCRVNPWWHTGVFYEYVRPPCVHLSFFADGKRIGDGLQRTASCANPLSAVAGEACCTAANPRNAANKCRFSGERLTYAAAQKRCETRFTPSRQTCDFNQLSATERCPVDPRRVWTSASCGVQAKVSAEGKIAIVHDVGQSPREESTTERMQPLLSRDTVSWFRALWEGDAFPSAVENNCAAGACETLPARTGEQPSCLCDTEVVEEAVFERLPKRKQALEQLPVGSAPIDSFDAGAYVKAGKAEDGVQAYRPASGAAFGTDTVFEVTVPGLGVRWLRNVRSMVSVKGTQIRFRNPPSFHDADNIETRDAYHETEAALDHYMEHPSTAPFLAKSLIQHLVTSNPSPRYVSAVAGAFRSGRYAGLGSGKYGDLLATAAAVLLDPEARFVVLDADPAAGKHRQSMLKVTHLMRALEYTSHDTQVVFRGIKSSLGMEPLDAPSVFSYYLPGYAPPGAIKKASLVAPETQLLTTPLIVSTLNGLFSLVKHGLTHCDGGLGTNPDGTQSCRDISFGDNIDPNQGNARGRLTFTPAAGEQATGEEVAGELSTLLTAGRLDWFAARTIAEAYDKEKARTGSAAKALRVAVQLVIASAHFQSSNQCLPLEAPRPEGPPGGAPDPRPYKAVVYVNFMGGMDSFNALVPKAGCQGGKDLYAEYARVRGEPVALKANELLDVDVSGQGQPCNTFGLNPSLDTVQKLFADGEAVLLANTGALVEPIAAKSAKADRPLGLFAHNIQQRAIQTAVPHSAGGTGMLGRLQDALVGEGFNAASYSIAGNADALYSDKGVAPRPDILDRRSGVPQLDTNPSSPAVRPALQKLNAEARSSLFGETWAGSLTRTMGRTEELSAILNERQLSQDFKAGGELGEQLEQVARLILARETLGSNRNAFYVSRGGFDTHNNGKTQLNSLLNEADNALDSFVQELKLQGVWDDVVVVFASEFGRTLTTNGVGTDHAWGGNYWMVGGGLKGGRMIGEFPDDLTDTNPLNLGRGRLIPTTSWDSVWNGIGQWLGVDEDGLNDVLPNRGNFAEDLFTAADLFK